MEKSIQEIKELLNSFKSKEEGNPCVYCGLATEEKDHIVPISHILKLREMKSLGFQVRIPEEKLVFSCHECNTIGSDMVFDSFREKKKYIKLKLKKKYKKFTKTPIWSDEEIDQLSGRLKEYIIIVEEIKKIVIKRINW